VKIPRPLPKGAVVGGIVVAGLVVLALGWMLVVSPQNKKAASLDKQTTTMQQQIASNLAQIAAAKNVVPAPTIRVADVYKLQTAMPSAPDMPDILLELSQVAKAAGVDLQSIAPGGSQTDPLTGQGSVALSLSVVGDFYTVTDLLYRLRNLVSVRDGALDAVGRLFAIDSVGLSPAGRTINASITLHTFVYGAPVAAPVAPVAPATTSTDTTATTTTTDTTSSSSASATGAP
jgi:hypothetical protein